MNKLLFRVVGVLFTITMLLSACGKKDNSTALPPNAVDQQVSEVTVNTDESVNANEMPSTSKNEVVVWNYRGFPITLTETPKKVVVISSVLVGILDELGVAVMGANTLADSVKSSLKYNTSITDIGSAVSPDMEMLKSLEPDMVIMGSAFGKLSADIYEAEIPLWMVDNQTYEQMMNVIDMFGDAFAQREKADELLSRFEARKNEIIAQTANQEKPSVLVLWGTDDELMVARDKSFACDVLKILGCHNVANDVELEPEVPNFMYILDEEVISKLNPDVIIRIYDGDPEKTKVHFDENDTKLSNGGSWSHMNAAKNNKVFTLQQDGFASNPGLLMMDSFETIAELVFDVDVDVEMDMQKTTLELSQGLDTIENGNR